MWITLYRTIKSAITFFTMSRHIEGWKPVGGGDWVEVNQIGSDHYYPESLKRVDGLSMNSVHASWCGVVLCLFIG